MTVPTTAWLTDLRAQHTVTQARLDVLLPELTLAEEEYERLCAAPRSRYDADAVEAADWVVADLNRAVIGCVAQLDALEAKIAGLEAATLAGRHTTPGRHLTVIR